MHPVSDCDHGCNVMIPNNHPVSNFMDDICINLNKNLDRKVELCQIILNSFETNQEVWRKKSFRHMTIKTLLAMGTNMLLRDDAINTRWTLDIIQFTSVLLRYDGTSSIEPTIFCRSSAAKERDLQISTGSAATNSRDSLKFLSKRIPCNCLKPLHSASRKFILKIGICWQCKEEMERVHLSVCSRCMITQFCSKECQVRAWPEHKSICDKYVRAHLQQHLSEGGLG